MRVLFVAAGYPPGARGGTEIHARDLAQALRRQGHEVAVFCRESDPRRPDYAERDEVVDGVAVRRLKYDFGDAHRFERIHENPRIDDAFARFRDAFAPDVVHVHHLTCLSTGVLDRAGDKGARVVATLHDFWTVCPRGQRITPELERCDVLDRSKCAPCLARLWPHFDLTPEVLRAADDRLRARLRRCDAWIAPSRFHRDRMAEFGLDPARFRVVEHGLDLAPLVAARRARTELRRVGFLGSVIPSKGVHVLLRGFLEAAATRPGLSLDVFGEAPSFHGDAGYLDRLKAEVPPGAAVRFRGAYDPAELPTLLAGLDLVVVPSVWWESFCLTLREAFAAGAPVLASDLGAMAEAFEEGRGGRKFRAGDSHALAQRLGELADDLEAYRALVASVPTPRAMDACARETADLYAALSGGAPSTGAAATPASVPEATRAVVATRPAVRRAAEEGRPYATVFIPTWNGGPLFETVLDKVLAQKTSFPFEVLVIDSGSKDGTVDAVRRRPSVRLLEIPNCEFNHGLTRNRAVAEARGDVVALLTQDAEPADDGWLERLVANFDDPRVAGAYCRQKPRPECNPFQRARLRDWTKDAGPPEIRELADRSTWDSLHPFDRYRLAAFDDVASCVRKSAMAEIPYAKRQFGEDVEWGKRAILAGWKIAMDPGATVIHSHDSPVLYEFKRVYLDHQNLHDLFGLHTLPKAWMVPWFATRYCAQLLPEVWSDDRGLLYRLWWTLKLPLYAFTQNLAQYLGAKSVRWRREGRMEWLDRRLRSKV
ncbi:MAG TPA: glycosyltransferase [Planctomycetota bacterium]|nr:glycosyltransferase [Planctomycetota bacterium]